MENINQPSENSNNTSNNDIKGIWANIKQFLFELLDIRQGTDKKRYN